MTVAGSTGDVPVDALMNSSAVLQVTKETMKKKTVSIIDEFLNIKDMKVSKRGSFCFGIVVVFFSDMH